MNEKPNLLSFFIKGISLNALSAGLSLLVSVIIIRFFGGSLYVDFIYDLALISIISICFEMIPSNFLIFKIQDDKRWLRILKVQLYLSIILLIFILYLFNFLSIFREFSGYFYLLVIALAYKKYLDIKLQAEGRVVEFYRIDCFAAIFKILFILTLLANNIFFQDLVWAAYTIGLSISLLIWNLTDRSEEHIKKDFSIYKLLRDEKNNIFQYYPGIVLKKIRDNIVYLITPLVVVETIQAFFMLIYRNFNSVIGQTRVIEAIVNYRNYLKEFLLQKHLETSIIILAQSFVILICSFSAYLSGLFSIEGLCSIIFLSLLTWPTIKRFKLRAQLLSVYDASSVNLSLLIWNLLFILFTAIFFYTHFANIFLLIFSILVSEYCAYLFMRFRAKIK